MSERSTSELRPAPQGMLGVIVERQEASTTDLFSDESRLSLQRDDGRVRVYRKRNERYADCSVLGRDRFGGWGFCHCLDIVIVRH